MFIWLASYPKSGNTLVRSMLAAYFFSDDGEYNFDLIKNIKQFPVNALFQRMGIDIQNEEEVIKNYIKVQASFNKKNSVQFLKTHSYLFNINNHAFTDLKNSLGAVYIVRDPRNVVSSLANHMGSSSEESADILINSFKFGNIFSDQIAEQTTLYLGTWNGNYNSWKSFKNEGRYLLIKYEDLIKDRDFTFRKILKFIYKLQGAKFKIDQKKFQNTIETTDFDRMKSMEKEKGFFEAKTHKETGKKYHFLILAHKMIGRNC